MKRLVVICILIHVVHSSFAQFRANRFRIEIFNVGFCHGQHTALNQWIKSYGAASSDFTFGGDLLNFGYKSFSNVVFGFGAGALYTKSNFTASLFAGYGYLYGGFSLYTDEVFEIIGQGNLIMYDYHIEGIVPQSTNPPPSPQYAVNGVAFGIGPSLKFQINLKRWDKSCLALSTEFGISFMNPQPNWSFDYNVPAYNTRKGYKTISSHITGPDVDSSISYVRIGFVYKGVD